MDAALRGTPRTRRLAAFIERRAGTILLATLAFAVLAIAGASRLGIDQRLRYLLPGDFPSVAGIDRVQAQLGNQSDVYVTIRGPDADANKRFAEAAELRMREMEELRWVLWSRDYSFFEDHALLYARLSDLLDLRRRVIEKIRREVGKQAYGDLSVLTEEEIEQRDQEDHLDEEELRVRYGVSDEPSTTFEADEGRLLVVKARPIQADTDIAFSRALQRKLEAMVEDLEPRRFHPEMAVTLDGAFVQHAERVQALRTEVVGGTAAAIGALLLAIAVYFRSARAIVLVLGPVLVSATGALAFAWVVFDKLNLVSAFIFAVLLGLGIDFGIHVLARFRDERARGHRRPSAMAVALATTGRSTLAAGLGTALAFGTLAVADFRGFAQFGVVAAFGIASALVGALLVMPAAVVWSERWKAWRAPPHPRRSRGDRRRWSKGPAMALAVVGIAMAAWAILQAGDLEFEHDLSKLGSRQAPPSTASAEGDAGAPSYRDAVGKAVTVAPAIGLAEDRDQAEAAFRVLAALDAMTPEEARSLPALPEDRAPTLMDALSPSRREPRAAGHAARPGDETAEAPGRRETRPGEDGRDEDGWDDHGFADDDLDDPEFVALERAAATRPFPAPAVRDALTRIDPERRAVLADRLVAVSGLFAFVPTRQHDKLRVIRDIRRRIDDKRGQLPARSRDELAEWDRYLRVDASFDETDLPGWVRQQFADADGEAGRFVVAWTRGSKGDAHNARRIYDALATVPTPGGDVPFAAEFFVLPEVFEAIEADAPLVLGLAAGAMLLTAFLALRSVGGPVAVAFVVATSLLWLVGLMVVLGWKLDFFNIIALPLLIGMAQDDALHIYQRWREEGRGRMALVLRETGGAVALTTLTTICGFAGILFANHRGLESLAWTAVAGMALAMVSAVVVLPALLELLRRP